MFISPVSNSLVAGPLSVVTPGQKDTAAKATAAISVIVPLDTLGVFASFGADPLLSGAASATVHPVLQPGTVAVGLVTKFMEPVINPVMLTGKVSTPSCSTPPTGTVEFLDGTASLGVIPLTADPSVLPIIEQSFGLNAPSSSSASISVLRPPGVHNISVRYSGDSHYLAGTSAPVAVTFQ